MDRPAGGGVRRGQQQTSSRRLIFGLLRGAGISRQDQARWPRESRSGAAGAPKSVGSVWKSGATFRTSSHSNTKCVDPRRIGIPCESASDWTERAAPLVGCGHGLFALVAAHGARCSFVSVGCFGAGSAMILPIARRESHRVSEYGGTAANSADLLKRIHQAAHPAISC
jgi:hypothetical protein